MGIGTCQQAELRLAPAAIDRNKPGRVNENEAAVLILKYVSNMLNL